jgi:FKBP-type peptidyl-prolyl cis-trans isomerase
MKKLCVFFAMSLVAAAVYASPAIDVAGKSDAAAQAADDTSYAFGMILGSQFKDMDIPFNYADYMKGFQAGIQGNPRLSEDDAVRLAQTAYAEAIERRNAARKAGEDQFLAENAKKSGVKTTQSGLQYEVISEGTGPKPAAEDTVEVNYEGKLIDGTVFDSSYERGESVEFSLTDVIDGWSEGLQLMNTGSRYRLYIPSNLAYGANGAGEVVPPYSVLIFEVELVSIVAPEDPPKDDPSAAQ